ncbi:MAG: type II secretion system F family protein [Methylophagaceae bacterium]
MRPQTSPEIIHMEASTDSDARRLAEQQGFTVLRIQSKGLIRRKSKFPLLFFCQELCVLLEAGLTLTEALETLLEKEANSDNRAILSSLLSSLRNGRQFSDALSAIPETFPGLFVASIKACETTGNLSEGLQRYSQYLEQIDILKKRIISASIYPALVLVFGGLVLLFLLGYVVPRFSQIYESRTMDLSFASEMLLTIGQTVENHGLLLLLILVFLVVVVTASLMQANVRAKITNLLTHIPQIGERLRIYHLSRFYRTFSMLLRSGIPVVSALGMVNNLLGDTLERNVTSVKHLISEGQSFTQAMSSCNLTTPVASQLFRVGEKSGKLDEMMERAANFHEDEMARWVDAFTKIFEPALMAAIGLLIGLIVLLMYLPIFELASGIQ